MSDAENTTREKLIEVLNTTPIIFDRGVGGHVPLFLGEAGRAADALIAAFPTLTATPVEPSDVEVMKLARVLYCADCWGVPDAGETWDEGMAFDHEYTRYERLARAAMAVPGGTA